MCVALVMRIWEKGAAKLQLSMGQWSVANVASLHLAKMVPTSPKRSAFFSNMITGLFSCHFPDILCGRFGFDLQKRDFGNVPSGVCIANLLKVCNPAMGTVNIALIVTGITESYPDGEVKQVRRVQEGACSPCQVKE